MGSLLVADIGGTNIRFAVASSDAATPSQFALNRRQTYCYNSFSSLESALTAYLSQLGTVPSYACLAVAGPVCDDRVKITNRDWSFSVSAIKRKFKFKALKVINDYAAVAYSTVGLPESDIYVLKEGAAADSAPRAIVGAGTGLGGAALIQFEGKWHPITSELGHASVAATTQLEQQILRQLAARDGHVSAEKLLSGPGLSNLYSELASLRGLNVEPVGPELIIDRALSGTDKLSVETLDVFCGFVGTFVGDVALTFCATGGVYLSGVIFCRTLSYMKTSNFSSNFCSKGVMSNYVKDIPVFFIKSEQPGLCGAAALLSSQLDGEIVGWK